MINPKSYSKKKPTRSKKQRKGQLQEMENNEMELYWLMKIPHYEWVVKTLDGIGLPVLDAEIINKQIIQDLINKPTDLRIIARVVSIKIEGCSKHYHKVKLGMMCLKYLQSLLGFEPISIERMMELIHNSTQVRTTNLKSTETQSYGFDDKFLSVIGMEDAYLKGKFRSTSPLGYYELNDINLLRDYGPICRFEEARLFRIIVAEVMKVYQNVLKHIQSREIDLVEEVLTQLFILKQSAIPFIIKNTIIEESKQEVQPIEQIMNTNIDKFLKCRKQQIQQQQNVQIKWDTTKQDQFLQQIQQSKNRYNTIEDINVIGISKCIKVVSNKSKQTRCVYYNIHDSCMSMNGHIMKRIQSINYRRPFYRYQWINYDQDSDDDVQSLLAEDISDGESKSDSETASSLSDFIANEQEGDDTPDWLINGSDTHVPYQHKVGDPDSTEYFKQFQAIHMQPNVKIEIKLESTDSIQQFIQENQIQDLLTFVQGKKGSRKTITNDYLLLNPNCTKYFVNKHITQKCEKIHNEWTIKRDIIVQSDVEFLQNGVNLFNTN